MKTVGIIFLQAVLCCVAVSSVAAESVVRRGEMVPGQQRTSQKTPYEKLAVSSEYSREGTLAFWCCPQGWHTGDKEGAWHFFCAAGSVQSNGIWLYRIPQNENLRLLWKGDSQKEAAEIIVKKPSFVSENWIHLALTWQVTEGKTWLKLYLNGNLAGERQAGFAIAAEKFPDEFRVGDLGVWTPRSKFSTVLGRTELVNKALDAEQIAALAAQKYQDGKITLVNRKFIPGSKNAIAGTAECTDVSSLVLQAAYEDEIGRSSVAQLPCVWNFRDGKSDFQAQLSIPDNTVTTKVTLLDQKTGTSPFWKLTKIDYAPFLPPFQPDFWHATWIWKGKSPAKQHRYFVREFSIGSPDDYLLAGFQWVCDGNAKAYLNGQFVGQVTSWAVPVVRDQLKQYLRPGTNVIAIEAWKDFTGMNGLFGELSLVRKDTGSAVKVGTDGSWLTSTEAIENWNLPGTVRTGWSRSDELMRPPQVPYGNTPYRNFAVCPKLQITHPVQLSAVSGECISFSLPCQLISSYPEIPLTPPASPVELTLLRRGEEIYRIPSAVSWKNKSHSELVLQGTLSIPPDAVADTYQILPVCRGWNVDPQLAQNAVLQIRQGKAREEKLVSSVQSKDGAVQLFLNGKMIPPQTYRAAINTRNSTRDHRFITSFQNIGLQLVECNINLKQIWQPDGSLNLDNLENRLLSTLFYAPRMNIILFINVDAPAWLIKKYPQDRFATEQGVIEQLSYASEHYRRETAEVLLKLVSYLKTRPYYRKIAGFGLDGGEDGQFMQWTGRNLNYLGDYSAPMKEKFNQVMNVPIPSAAKRKGTEPGRRKGDFFLTPGQDDDLIAYNEVYAEAPADFLLRCASALKTASSREKIVLAYYGKFFSIAGYNEWGELALRKVLESKDVDCLIAVEYNQRAAGCPHSVSAPMASYQLHRKLFIDEADLRTFLSGAKNWAYTGTSFETISVVRKMFAFSFTGGHGIHWYDLFGGVFENQAILESIQHVHSIGERLKETPREPAEIAVIVDERSFLYTRSSVKGLTGRTLLHMQNGDLGRIGAPFDCYLASDLSRIPAEKYKLFIFLNLWAPDQQMRQAVERLKNRGRVLLFLGNAGMLSPGMNLTEEKAVEQLTGIAVRKIQNAENLTLKLKNGDSLPAAWSRALPEVQYSSTGFLYPCLLPKASEKTRVFGQVMGVGKGEPAIGYRKYADWTGIYCAVCRMTPEFYRGVASEAGVHLYSQDNDAMICCGKALLSVHSGQGGSKTIFFPKKVTVIDAVTKQPLAEQVLSVTLQLLPGETRLLQFK